MTGEIFLSIIIPAFNEEKRIPMALVPTIDFLKKQSFTSEIIVVSDGSQDQTKVVAESFKNIFQNLSVIEYSPNRGKGYAVKTGMLNARGKYRLFMDADYAVPIEHVDKFLMMIDKDFDIVIGSRAVKQAYIEKHQPFFREFLAKCFGRMQQIILGLPIRDSQCGFKLFTDKMADYLFNRIVFDCAYFDAELLYLACREKARIAEVGVHWKHDDNTRLPIGILRSFDLLKKMFIIRIIHK
jgi:glycosyltransferase involved in cell wall biosynthesis